MEQYALRTAVRLLAQRDAQRDDVSTAGPWLPAFRIPVSPTPSATPMNPAFRSPALLLNIHRPGPVPLCHPDQEQRNLIARMKLIPVEALIKNRSLLLIDDSIVRGTQLRETTEFLYNSGAKEVHIRPACPPLLFGCPFLNFSRSKSEMDLITRRIIAAREGETVSREVLDTYADPDSQNYKEMLEEIGRQLNFTTLHFHRLDDLLSSINIEPCKVCTYCFNGKK